MNNEELCNEDCCLNQECNRQPLDQQIIDLMISQSYEDRFKAEVIQTKIRGERLSEIINKHFAGELDFKLSCPVGLLMKQLEAMQDYLDILAIRAEIEGIDLEY